LGVDDGLGERVGNLGAKGAALEGQWFQRFDELGGLVLFEGAGVLGGEVFL
jgi:hypothetical protein